MSLLKPADTVLIVDNPQTSTSILYGNLHKQFVGTKAKVLRKAPFDERTIYTCFYKKSSIVFYETELMLVARKFLRLTHAE